MREAATNLSPMFRQYRSLKAERADSILLFRMGDFYEMFYEDAQVASRVLELTLTARGKGTDNVVPMCGFPYHQLESYCARLVRSNFKVAVCEQVEDPKQTKGLVRREVVRVVTPGTINDPSQLDAKSNLWIGAVAANANRLGAAFLDVSTGEFLAWESSDDEEEPATGLAERLREFAPKELVFSAEFAWPGASRDELAGGTLLTPIDAFAFNVDECARLLRRQFSVASLDGFGVRDRFAAVSAAGGLLRYVLDTQKSGLEHIDGLRVHEPGRLMRLDAATRRNLELVASLREGTRQGSLIQAIDATLTAPGGRLLRRWLLAPLLDAAAILRRLDAVEELTRKVAARERLRELLRGVHDIERLLARTIAGSAGAGDLLALSQSLDRLPDLIQLLGAFESESIHEIPASLDPCRDVVERLRAALNDDPPATLREGGVIRDGFDAELDELRAIKRDGRAYIASLEAAERQATGIGSLKVRFNKVFGYFIEVSRSNLPLVPEHYQRKQTVANAERYITPELKEHEAKVLNAQERIEALELELFQRLRADIARQASRLKAVARALARLDVFAGLAQAAVDRGYTRPQIDDGPGLTIVGGRHPVVERCLIDERFVPNDTDLEAGARAIGILTGPNMGGKSTYLRQVALIALMAQSGSFVPAERARVGLVDRIFCRVGASDSLAEGQSTFMVEMSETANILHHAGPRSLLLLDEIGRGTATFDGLSIAWAMVEHLDAIRGGAPRTLFATHYHELTELSVELGSVINLRMVVRDRGGQVAFLHRVESGAADRSYGIHVARLAGMPNAVVRRAQEILTNLERDEYGRDGLPRRARRKSAGAAQAIQPGLFDRSERGAGMPAPPSIPVAEVLAELRRQDPTRMTPLEALNRIDGWRRKLLAESDEA